MNYRNELINNNNLTELFKLFQNEHGNKFSLNYFRNKFETSWTEKSYIGYFAVSEKNETAAFYGGFPCQMIINGEKQLVLQSGDTITNENHRKKGLFIRLAEETYHFAESEGFEFVFGFPNKNSEHGFFHKLGWQNLGTCTNFTFTFSNFNWFGLCHKFSFLKPLYNLFWKKQLKKLNTSANEVLKYYEQNYNGVLKDANFLHYKLNYGNSGLVKINNQYFWIKKDNGIQIGELFLSNEEIDIYNYLKPLAKVFGVKQIQFSCNEHHPLYSNLMKSKTEKNIGLVVGFRGLKNKDLPNNLTFVSGDSDDF
jgi:hypothetical protein